MSGIGIGPVMNMGASVEIAATRAVVPVPPAAAQGSAAARVPVTAGAAFDAGGAPVDQDRVVTIRKAIASNSYPVVPAKIGDAMIAAGMLLRLRA